jgi:hypothetical protein
MASVLLYIVMDISIKASFPIIKNRGMELNSILMAIYILAIFGRIKNMAKAHFIGLISAHLHALRMQE